MNGSVIAMLFMIATLVIGLGLFAVYGVVLAPQYSNVSLNEQVIAISKLTTVYVSQMAFYSYAVGYTNGQQVGQYTGNFQGYTVVNYSNTLFNVSYLVAVDSPLKEVVLVPFVIKAVPEPFYAVPKGATNATIMRAGSSGYLPVKTVQVSGVINIPQYGSIGPVSVTGYLVNTNTTYVLTANVTRSSVVLVWVLAKFDNQWYRIGYVYMRPADTGLGVLVPSLSGSYYGYSGSLNNPAPHIYLSNTGVQVGLWFFPYINYTKPSVLINVTFVPTGSSTSNKLFNVIFYTVGSKLYFNVTNGGPSNVLVYSKLSAGSWYFLNFSVGSIVSTSTSKNMTVTIYGSNKTLLNTSSGYVPTSLNGYTLVVKYGSSYAVNAISQSFGETIKNNGGLPYFYNVSSIVLKNGPMFNNTYFLNYTIANSNGNLYALTYLFSVSPYYPPPSTVSEILWYYPSGNARYPSIYIINETGSNVYLLV